MEMCVNGVKIFFRRIITIKPQKEILYVYWTPACVLLVVEAGPTAPGASGLPFAAGTGLAAATSARGSDLSFSEVSESNKKKVMKSQARSINNS